MNQSSRGIRTVIASVFVPLALGCATAPKARQESVGREQPKAEQEVAWQDSAHRLAARVVVPRESVERVFLLDLASGRSRLSDGYERVFGVSLSPVGELTYVGLRGGRAFKVRDLEVVEELAQGEFKMPEAGREHYPVKGEGSLKFLSEFYVEKQGAHALKVYPCGWNVCAAIDGKSVAEFEGFGDYGYPVKNDKLEGAIVGKPGKTREVSESEFLAARQDWSSRPYVYQFENDYAGNTVRFLAVDWFLPNSKPSFFYIEEGPSYATPSLDQVLETTSPGPGKEYAYLLLKPESGDGCPSPHEWLKVSSDGEVLDSTSVGGCHGELKTRKSTREKRVKGKPPQYATEFTFCEGKACKTLVAE